jgi:hypothetical protein
MRIEAVAHKGVGEGYAGGNDPDAYFSRAWFGKIFSDGLQNLGTAMSGDDDASVFHERLTVVLM